MLPAVDNVVQDYRRDVVVADWLARPGSAILAVPGDRLHRPVADDRRHLTRSRRAGRAAVQVAEAGGRHRAADLLVRLALSSVAAIDNDRDMSQVPDY